MTTVLCTGGAGFLGSHYVDFLLKNTDWDIVVWDCLNYSSKDAWRLREIGAFASTRFRFENVDIGQMDKVPASRPIDYIVHLAAETHVDNSIKHAWPFIQSNVVGTFKMLEYARLGVPNLKRFLYFSTDEVFGPWEGVTPTEFSGYNSSNPYAATKAAAEELCVAWKKTYNLPVVISHCCNVFGERQHEEKFIPKLVKAISGGHMVTIHADEEGKSGSRMYVYAGDVARAIQLMITNDIKWDKFNIPGKEVSNEEMALCVALALDKKLISRKAFPYAERPGWDFSYKIDGTSLCELLGWKPSENFIELLNHTVRSMK